MSMQNIGILEKYCLPFCRPPFVYHLFPPAPKLADFQFCTQRDAVRFHILMMRRYKRTCQFAPKEIKNA